MATIIYIYLHIGAITIDKSLIEHVGSFFVWISPDGTKTVPSGELGSILGLPQKHALFGCKH